jgi:hypothetical protein
MVDKYQREWRKGILTFSSLMSMKSSPIATMSKIVTMRERRMNHPFMATPGMELEARPLTSMPWIHMEATMILPAAKICGRVNYVTVSENSHESQKLNQVSHL